MSNQFQSKDGVTSLRCRIHGTAKIQSRAAIPSETNVGYI